MNLTDYEFKNSYNLNKDAIICNTGEKISYKELYKKICGLANYIKDIKNEKIIIFSDNSIFSIICFYSIIKSGNVCIPLSTDTSIQQLEYIIQTCKSKTLFCQKKYVNNFSGFKNINIYNEKDLEYMSNCKDIINEKSFLSSKSEVALILFTSGSTRLPKGVMLTNENLICNTDSNIKFIKMTEKDRIELILPYYHCYGMNFFNTLLRVGGSLVLNNSFLFPQTVIDDIEKYLCTGFAGVPSTYQILIKKTDFLNCKFPYLRFMTQAGGVLSKIYSKKIVNSFENIEFYAVYGQTEAAGSLTYADNEKLMKNIDTIGKAVPNTIVKIVDKCCVEVKPGEVGEIIASGGNIMKCYFNDDEETSQTIIGNWLYTGDLGTTDEEGNIYIVSRKKNIIKCGGYRVSAKEVEDVLLEIEQIEEVAIIAVEDDILGEAIKAFIVLDKKQSYINKDNIIDYCRKRLPSYKVPKFIEYKESLPKNKIGKVLLGKLK